MHMAPGHPQQSPDPTPSNGPGALLRWQGESGKLSCRAHFLQAGQKGCIDETSHNYSSVLLKPGDVVVMESGYAIPHQSNKRSVKATAAAAWDYNAVLVYYQAKCDTKQHN